MFHTVESIFRHVNACSRCGFHLPTCPAPPLPSPTWHLFRSPFCLSFRFLLVFIQPRMLLQFKSWLDEPDFISSRFFVRVSSFDVCSGACLMLQQLPLFQLSSLTELLLLFVFLLLALLLLLSSGSSSCCCCCCEHLELRQLLKFSLFRRHLKKTPFSFCSGC